MNGTTVPSSLKRFFVVVCLSASFSSAGAQDQKSLELPVARVALFSSGVGYFEHSGHLSGDAVVGLPFRAEEVNDVLKSLVVFGGAEGGSPSVSYPAKEDSERTLKTFGVDLSGSPQVAELLARMRGSEIELSYAGAAPGRFIGRILSVEARPASAEFSRVHLALMGGGVVRSVALDDVGTFRFTDPALDADFKRALELIGKGHDRSRTTLELRLPGTGNRRASFGYVAAAPVWKASYRLDLSGEKPFLQGWAIVDNSTDRDWRGVSLSLVSGRPVSFIQNLYDPVYVSRPVVPLAIAGSATPREYAEGIPEDAAAFVAAEAEAPLMSRLAAAPLAAPAPSAKASPRGRPESLSDSAFDAALTRAAGDQFEFTIPRPVDLDRGRSALLPLVAGNISAEKVSLYSAGDGRAFLGARMENSTGMKLPAGPVTVYADGLYAGDALLDFLSEKESRLIAFGEDLSLTVEESAAAVTETVGVNVSKGVLTFAKRRSFSKTYTLKNSDAEDKTVMIEHPETAGASLSAPSDYLEKSDGKYRFRLDVASGKRGALVVVERTPTKETVSLSAMNADAYLRYSSSSEIPAKVRDALAAAAGLRRKADDAQRVLRELIEKKAEIVADQSRVRDNLEALGRETAEGKAYLQRLLASEAELDRLNERIEQARKNASTASADFERYVSSLDL